MIGLILKYLKRHLPNPVHYYIVLPILLVLEVTTGIALLWYFLGRDILPLSSEELAYAGGAYSALALIFIILNLSGKLLCFKVQGFFYLSVSLFFMLKGIRYLGGHDFNPWGFYTMWVLLVIITFRETLLEMRPGIMGDDDLDDKS